MMILITYDVNTENSAGKRRLRLVAKECVNYGQRVQNSVFECLIDEAQFVFFKQKILSVIDAEVDSIRFYKLGDKYKNKVEAYGVNLGIRQDDVLLL